ncbi:MAG TPA: hypothetical protein VG204_06870 [Terriglobia bacterium]|nr:hypothetical protein [Terriglobia bacterium]
MNTPSSVAPAVEGPSSPASRARAELFLISFVLLFLELACIRWFPAHVLFLTFFTNTILLACFLGMSLGCLAARRPRDFMADTPVLLLIVMGAALGVQFLSPELRAAIQVGNGASPQVVFFGNDYRTWNPGSFFIPVEMVEGFFFFLVALAMVGPGQELGRALDRLPNRVEAYTFNILGSLAGIAVFAIFSRWELSPFWWFLVIVLGLGYYSLAPSRSPTSKAWAVVCLGLVVVAGSWTTGVQKRYGRQVGQHLWSPYYRIDYTYSPVRNITVNLIGHQQMVSTRDPYTAAVAYSLPYLFERDTGGKPFEDALIIGAGSGNDVSRALQWGVQHIDAVEIDPVILQLGKLDHPDHPYADPRVTTHLGDGRNFLRSSDRQYDLVIYALVDSLVLHSSYSDLRLESFLFTREALADVRRHLKPGGLFIMYNYFRQGWIVARIDGELRDTFQSEPLVLTFPYSDVIQPGVTDAFTMFVSGATKPWQQAFTQHALYWMRRDQPPAPGSANGFDVHPPAGQEGDWLKFGPAKVIQPEAQRAATDDWPFLYVSRPMIPALGLRGMAMMGGLAFLLLFLFLRERPKGAGRWKIDGRMFFLGAGFMLLETEAVVHMALLFGSTWMVNTVVFMAVLVMILGANLYVLKRRPERLWPYYAGLMLSLALNILIPLDYFLGMDRGRQVAASCLLVFTPILFAGVIFAVAFSRSLEPDSDFGANVGGAILGGLAEYSSTLLGFQYLTALAIVFYALSAALARKASAATTQVVSP